MQRRSFLRQALRRKQSSTPIENLYSAGEFGSIWGNMYQGTGNIGECVVFGRIAARNAMAK